MTFNKIRAALGAIGIVLIHFSFAFGQTSSAEEKILLDLENQRAEALTNKNWGVLNSIYHDQFRGVSPTGVAIDKKSLIEIYKSLEDASYSNEDTRASIYGYAGVTSVKQIQRGKNGSVITQTRLIHVYVKRSGKWTIVEGQGTIILSHRNPFLILEQQQEGPCLFRGDVQIGLPAIPIVISSEYEFP